MIARFDRRTASYWLAAAWIAATASFFYLRFTSVVYQAHKHEIDGLIDRLFR
jgi:hypothetical protein